MFNKCEVFAKKESLISRTFDGIVIFSTEEYSNTSASICSIFELFGISTVFRLLHELKQNEDIFLIFNGNEKLSI